MCPPTITRSSISSIGGTVGVLPLPWIMHLNMYSFRSSFFPPLSRNSFALSPPISGANRDSSLNSTLGRMRYMLRMGKSFSHRTISGGKRHRDTNAWSH